MTITGNQRWIVMQKLAGKESKLSRCIVLKNMVGPEDVDQALEQEVTEECSKFGLVEKVIIYQETQNNKQGISEEVIVKIFILFRKSDDARNAVDALNNRFFGGRKIKAEFYDEIKFLNEDLTGDLR